MAVPLWKTQLWIPCSFRGVPFKWWSTGEESGRRAAVTEFPFRDTPYVEDLGRRAKYYPLTGHVIGDNYMAARDALRAALQAQGPGTLIHPYLGPLTVQLLTYVEKEEQLEGGLARFDMRFVEAGGIPSPRAATDTAAATTAASTNASTQVQADYVAQMAAG
jgi:prophage DNA circulation protein